METDPTNPGELIEGTYIDLVCNATLNIEEADSDINIEWMKDENAIVNGSDFQIISEQTLVNGSYTSRLHITELKTGVSNGSYRCSVTVVGKLPAVGSESVEMAIMFKGNIENQKFL